MNRIHSITHALSWSLLSLLLISAALIALTDSRATLWASRHTALTPSGQHQQVAGYVAVPCLLWFVAISALMLPLLIAAGALRRPGGTS